jgi:Zn-finger nucleic acid-binding protein
MQCAKCSGVLSPIEIGPIQVDKCGRCSGLWFDRDELDAVLLRQGGFVLEKKAGAGEGPSPYDHLPGTCPRCQIRLERIPSLIEDDLGYDECAQCGGIWLDAGELTSLQEDPSAAAIISFFSGAVD